MSTTKKYKYNHYTDQYPNTMRTAAYRLTNGRALVELSITEVYNPKSCRMDNHVARQDVTDTETRDRAMFDWVYFGRVSSLAERVFDPYWEEVDDDK